MVKKSIFFIRFYVKAFRRLEIMNKAASLSYYTIISIFPMILVGATLMSQFLSQDVMLGILTKVMDQVIPFKSELVMENVSALFTKRVAFSWLGVGALLISAQILYVNFGVIVNRLVHAKKPRNFLVNRLFFLLWLLGLMVVLVSPMVFEVSATWLKARELPVPGVSTFLIRGGFVLMSFMIFLVVMLIMPTRKINLKRMLCGGLAFAIILQLGKVVFKWTVMRQLGRYNLIYGSLTSMVLVTLWIFYYYNIFLFFVYWVGRDQDPAYVERKIKAKL